ncbi:MotA/TolQ/ExbB proton channel family protein [Fibrobacter sp.]|uniref:MotA/TolQ/ExbB proton channel family protein n=1 Tax=Fibrobacter sp. TaxID=35828 RepID=UPI0025B96256|nr:MotA/TolQ/ExbB proton channel family protein [Fibrobacter sp.]
MIAGVDQNSLFEAAVNILLRGGWVLAPIFLLGWFGWFLMIERYGYYFMLKGRSIAGFWRNLRKRGEDVAFEKLSSRPYGYFYSLVKDVREYRDLGPVAVRNAMEATRHSISVNLSKSLKTISTCAALAPMMGLLGTVSGMVHTFETIQQFGFGNPVLLADGISEALLTTQAGLLVAFPLMLAYNYLAGCVEKVEDEAWSEALKFESFAFENKGAELANPVAGDKPVEEEE